MIKEKKYEYGLGRRKQSTAQVKLFQGGNGNIMINKGGDKVSIKEYFGGHDYLIESALHSFYTIGSGIVDRFDLDIKVSGGGLRGQADAIKLAISRALVSFNSEYRLQLKPFGLLKRDSREKERKKFGLKKARKSPQWTKR
ncbi:30S ribosomal protein S9 [Candidatus Vampirococcus lugosii]|uniref:Small ribosomal subunit protein uS9 n=1 Tax=Candidatus Vampirococcus lugosii TaxID=2789015 RepID=A0ABS5QJI1_9BACT|nr:30S ribosomal protein S9 [Candidatus Vampirococcus lugosii]